MTEGHLTVALLLLMIMIGLIVLPGDMSTPVAPSNAPPDSVQRPQTAPSSRSQPGQETGKVVRLISVSR
jgi:hypothetical protein